MSMFCYQCQETAMNKGCTVRGVCGKLPKTAKLQDLLIYTAKALSTYIRELNDDKECQTCSTNEEIHMWIVNSLFVTITNANFDDQAIISEINKGCKYIQLIKSKLQELNKKIPNKFDQLLKCCSTHDEEQLLSFAESIGVMRTANDDVRSLRETIIYGVKGMCAYVEHAYNLGMKNPEIFHFIEYVL
ncbi:MAG: hydroxylamine reductase, partial [Lentisphaeria bacterium]